MLSREQYFCKNLLSLTHQNIFECLTVKETNAGQNVTSVAEGTVINRNGDLLPNRPALCRVYIHIASVIRRETGWSRYSDAAAASLLMQLLVATIDEEIYGVPEDLACYRNLV